MKTIKALSILVLLAGNLVIAQDLHFSQFNQAPLLLNPANAGGSAADQRAILNYKDQWRSVAKAYRTYAFSFDMSLSKKMKSTNYLGLGINVFADRSGDVNLATTQADLFVAYHMKLNSKNYLSGGIRGGVSQRSIDPNAMEWGNQYDPNMAGYNSSFSSNENMQFDNFLHADFAGGVNWNYASKDATLSSNDALKANVGFSVMHINAPKLDYNVLSEEERLYTRYIVHAKLSQGIKNTHLQLQPSGYFQTKRTSREIVVGTSVRYILKEESKYTDLVKGAAVSVGAHYRVQDALIISSLFEFGKFALGASYDINISGLTKASRARGGFEIALQFRTPNPFKEQKVSCKIYVIRLFNY